MESYYNPIDCFEAYDFVALDVTSQCNLRCPFCLNDWSTIGKNHLMSTDVFDKFVEIMPLVREGPTCYISCLFEPLLHPDFIELVDRVPLDQRSKIFFTTNLSSRISDEVFERLASSGIHHVSVSLDSLTPQVFEEMRRPAKFPRFIRNLERLVTAFGAHPSPPRIHYETVVCTLNVAEVPTMYAEMRDRYRGAFMDFRPAWQWQHTEDWLREKYIDHAQYEQLGRELGSADDLLLAPLFAQEQFMEKRDLVSTVPPHASLRILSDGTVDFLERDVLINIADIANPRRFFKDMLKFVSLDTARAQAIAKLSQTEEELPKRAAWKRILDVLPGPLSRFPLR